MDAGGRYTLVRPTGDEALAGRGLRVLVGGPEGGGGSADIDQKLAGFLAYAQSVGLDATRQVLALEHAGGGQRVAGVCLWVPSPGRTAMLFGTNTSEFPDAAPATTLAVAAAMTDARAAGVVLVQSMVEPSDAAGKTVFAGAGMTQLATLTYMERKPPVHVAPLELPETGGYTLEPYSASTHPLFAQAILASYEATLDCPALSGMRDIEDVILGHQAVGPFDPQLWSVLLRFGKPVGCLLLGEIPARRALELVYLGLAAPARGQGLGRILMRRVLSVASRRHFAVATLAVDAANGPALHLYRRCGYTSIAQRVALVRRLA